MIIVPEESPATAWKLLQPETVLAELCEANMAIKVLTLIRPTPTTFVFFHGSIFNQTEESRQNVLSHLKSHLLVTVDHDGDAKECGSCRVPCSWVVNNQLSECHR
jgi:hypothetical protein